MENNLNQRLLHMEDVELADNQTTPPATADTAPLPPLHHHHHHDTPPNLQQQTSPNAESADDDSHGDTSVHVLSLLYPVVATMTIACYLVHTLDAATTTSSGGLAGVMVYDEKPSDSAGTVAVGVLENAGAIVLLLFVVTTVLMLLYKLRCYRIIYSWLLLSVASLLAVFGGLVGYNLLELYGVPLDWPSAYFLLYNFSVGGTVLVFWSEVGLGPSRPPRRLVQSYLVIISALMAWSGSKLPEWSTWGVLAAVALWDIIAVLTPRGPLKVIVDISQERGDSIPGLVYEGDDIKLGLGDFIFYSLLVGRASMHGVVPAVACAISVLTGLCATLALLPVIGHALPALPISIALGIATFFVAEAFLEPLAEMTSERAIVF